MLEDLKSDISKLIALYEGEKQRADALQARLEQCEKDALSYRTQITELNGQIDDMKLSLAFTGGGDPAVGRERIGKLIREIDKCIKLLEKDQ